MIILIAGGTHTGKTAYAQKLLDRYRYPYLSIDHLKMGLIRSGYCSLTPESDESALKQYLWPVVREIINTAIENRQNLIIEGCYIPFDYRADFSPNFQRYIQYVCLILSEGYIQSHYDNILKQQCVIERRAGDDDITRESLIQENRRNLEQCKEYGLAYALIENSYEIVWVPKPEQ